jgi:hypothetical protein
VHGADAFLDLVLGVVRIRATESPLTETGKDFCNKICQLQTIRRD